MSINFLFGVEISNTYVMAFSFILLNIKLKSFYQNRISQSALHGCGNASSVLGSFSSDPEYFSPNYWETRRSSIHRKVQKPRLPAFPFASPIYVTVKLHLDLRVSQGLVKGFCYGYDM